MHGCSSSTGSLDSLSHLTFTLNFQTGFTINVPVDCHFTSNITTFFNQTLRLFITNPFLSYVLSCRTLNSLTDAQKCIPAIQHVNKAWTPAYCQSPNHVRNITFQKNLTKQKYERTYNRTKKKKRHHGTQKI